MSPRGRGEGVRAGRELLAVSPAAGWLAGTSLPPGGPPFYFRD